MNKDRWFWATLTLSSITIVSVVFAAWEIAENRFFRDANYLTLHYLYITRGVASSMLLAFWAAWFVLKQRRQSEDELRRSRERYRGLLEAFPGAVVLYDSSLQVLEWNAAADRLYGYPKEEAIGNPLAVVPPSKSEELRDFIREVEQGHLVLDVETLRQAKTGPPFEVQLSLLPYEERGGPMYFLEIASDIRERVRWRQRMIEIEKLASMGQMAAGTAHHLNSPLAALLIRVQMMRQQIAGGAVAEDALRLEEGLQFCRHFVQRLLDFTRVSQVHKDAQELASLVESISAFFLPAIQAKGVSLAVDAAAGRGCRIHADRNLLETLLLILLSNALDAVPRGGEIRISCWTSPGHGGISVADNGCGIAPEHLSRIFEPFFTTKEPGKGTGLGLAIARNVVLEHGGSIHLDSEPGRGTTVRVELPIASGSQLAARMAS